MAENIRASGQGKARLQEPWEEQWEQVRLGLERVTAIYAGRWGSTADALYDIRAFFLTCHHLGEWIIGDDTVPPAARDKAGEVVESSAALKICTDIANGLKHRTLTTTKTGDLSTALSASDPTYIYVGPEGDTQHNFRVTSGGNEYDVLELARRCVSDWASFLQEMGVDPWWRPDVPQWRAGLGGDPT